MEDYGYSRERAQTALLREISRGDGSPPGDQEVFDVMAAHGLGIESASRALTVSKALQRETSESKISMLEAIDDLSARLSVSNLVRKGRESPSPLPASPCDDVVSIARPSGVRIRPVAHKGKVAARSKSTTTATSITPTTTVPNGRKTKSLGKTSKQKNAHGSSRKRSVEDMTVTGSSASGNPSSKKEETTNIFPSRARSDSLSDVVSAKFGEKNEEIETSSVRSAAGPNAVPVRTKRGRADDPEATPNSMKRSRTATTGDL